MRKGTENGPDTAEGPAAAQHLSAALLCRYGRLLGIAGLSVGWVSLGPCSSASGDCQRRHPKARMFFDLPISFTVVVNNRYFVMNRLLFVKYPLICGREPVVAITLPVLLILFNKAGPI